MARSLGAWAMCSQPRPEIAYVLAWEIVAVAAIVWGTVRSAPSAGQDWARFGALLVCASVHVFFSRRQEETRRNRTLTLHVELTSIWTFPAALVLPIPLAVLLIVVIRLQRWFVARRPIYRYVFASLVMGGCVVAVNSVLRVTAVPDWTATGWLGSLRVLWVLVIAAAVYTGIQILVIGGAVALHTSEWTLSKVIGTRYDNGLEVLTAALGAVTAALLVNIPALLVVMVMLGVAGNYIAEVRQLHADARTDPKTDLLNMRGWRDLAQRELTRAARSNTQTGLLMLDMDYFKTINDTWGHPAGDDMLLAVARTLREETRPGDVIGRFGGEEFVVLLPDASRQEAAAVAGRILQAIRSMRVMTTDKRGGPVVITGRTASIGVASHPPGDSTLDGLLQAADAAVYEAKDTGRDRLRLA
ncbi:MAG: diguanylate cyclase [Sciscionella sp.]